MGRDTQMSSARPPGVGWWWRCDVTSRFLCAAIVMICQFRVQLCSARSRAEIGKPARLTKELAGLLVDARQARACLELATTTVLHLAQMHLLVLL